MKNKTKSEGTSLGMRILRSEATRSIVSSVLCIIGGILVGAIILILLAAFSEDIPMSDAFSGLLIILGGPFASGNAGSILFNLGDMLLETAPLMMTGLSVAIAFKTGLFNIGAPGQYLMGAMSSLLVALSIPTNEHNAFFVWLLALIAGVLSGMLWGAIPGFFKAVFNVNEVIVCIMTNWIAANTVSWIFSITGERYVNIAETKTKFIRTTASNGVSTAKLGLDKLFPGSNIDISIFIVILVAVVMYIMINKTTFGYELKACGYNKNAARYAGMNEKRNVILSMAIAGGLAAGGEQEQKGEDVERRVGGALGERGDAGEAHRAARFPPRASTAFPQPCSQATTPLA